jgi:hypothetical protein
MEPLNPYEIQELMNAMGAGAYPYPVGSIWSNVEASQMFLVLYHANLPSPQGPIPCIVLQGLPNGDAWIQPIEAFAQDNWHNIGFVWDRGVTV